MPGLGEARFLISKEALTTLLLADHAEDMSGSSVYEEIANFWNWVRELPQPVSLIKITHTYEGTQYGRGFEIVFSGIGLPSPYTLPGKLHGS